MAPHVSCNLLKRSDYPSGDDNHISGIIIAGIAVAAAIGVGTAVWLTMRWYRKHSAEKREKRRGSAFVNFTDPGDEKDSLPSAGSTLPVKGTFSRDQLSAGVVMPERAVLRPGASRDEIIEHYAAEGKLPRPFAPYAPKLSIDTEDAVAEAMKRDSGRPSSTASWLSPGLLAGSRNSRMSVMSTSSSLASANATQKKVRQIFDPVLPDELVVALGESLTVVQNHDDGWCIVGRDSMLKPGEVELGAVPAWCFLKPVKGLRAERPMRVSSLGVTINLDAAPSFEPRDNVMSWSNF
ncbi:hypothetical protein PYCCODRAFT_930492 [Trametes coccinea BRFM310]|uniref:SH3 domain-containing protein n=1 Tax=Trametes coccinea (strain BRFM310) TaxID=1353009 RepID=A0A1Y2J1U6_TRAC3|nr:hypothetical protein PYCCODRAFT_930492 [Trametes coccinea BRFM310]